MMRTLTRLPRLRVAAVLTAATLGLAACGGAATSAPAGGSGSGDKTVAISGTARVLPVPSNPMTSTGTAKTLTVDKVLVENNVDAKGKATDDHLEVTVKNTGSTPLTGLEFFYTFTDKTASASESYYAKLPFSATVPAGGTYTVNFDNKGAAGSVPVNEFSLYATSKNALDVEVVASAAGTAPTTATVKKDAGGAEAAD